METPVLSIENISKFFGKKKVLDNVSLSVEKGEIFGLLGSNGAGKSTLAQIAAGTLKQDSGKVILFGQDLTRNKIQLSKKIAVVPQDISLYSKFSVEENIRFFGSLYGLKRSQLNANILSILNDFNLLEFRHAITEHLSGGYKRLVNIACSVIHQPELIFLDEPTVGLDPKFREVIWKKILEMKQKGQTIILTTHYLEEAQSLCDRLAILDQGKIRACGKTTEIVNKYGKDLTYAFLKIVSD